MAVLIVDDDESILGALRLLLKSEDMDCIVCRSPKEALGAFRREGCELALVDLNYVDDTTSGREGLELITALREMDEDFPIIAMTGWGTIGIAVEAMRRGAADFVQKPWDDNGQLLSSIRAQIKLRAVRKRESKLAAPKAAAQQGQPRPLLGASPEMRQLLGLAERVAAGSIPILITGENGTGKSLLASYIHQHSPFASGPFVSVNMGAIAEGTFESEMFGHVKGAFTDAKAERIGRVELADHGTLFMDEIANMPLAQQAKILRLLEEQKFERLGSSQSLHAAIRFVSATNADLDHLIAERGFRRDLLYRLNGVTLRMPSLRERKADIGLLAESFLQGSLERCDSPARRLSESARRALEGYSWPGNVRELQNVIERSVLLAGGESIEVQDLQLASHSLSTSTAVNEFAGLRLDEAEIRMIQQALNRHQGNPNEAARELGISRSALYRRLGKREPQ
jgi:DNA-binding NtrC family response regulator